MSEDINKQLSELRQENAQLHKDKNDLLSRLSQLAGVKVTENNPAVADLSDLNRPTNLGEAFSELYDNEYTDLVEKTGSEKDKIHHILITAEQCYNFCKDREQKQFLDILKAFGVNGKQDQSFLSFEARESLPKGLIKHIKECRSAIMEMELHKLEKEYFSFKTKDSAKESTASRRENQRGVQAKNSKSNVDDKETQTFTSSCLKLFWKACIQTPPLYFDFRAAPGSKFDNSLYRTYTKSGQTVDYVVWPVIYLYEKGPVLSKGVVQCVGDKITSKSKPNNSQQPGTQLTNIPNTKI